MVRRAGQNAGTCRTAIEVPMTSCPFEKTAAGHFALGAHRKISPEIPPQSRAIVGIGMVKLRTFLNDILRYIIIFVGRGRADLRIIKASVVVVNVRWFLRFSLFGRPLRLPPPRIQPPSAAVAAAVSDLR